MPHTYSSFLLIIVSRDSLGLLSILAHKPSRLSDQCIIPPGSRVVKLEGPKARLQQHVNRRGFLVPTDLDSHARKGKDSCNLTSFQCVHDFRKKELDKEQQYSSMPELHKNVKKICDTGGEIYLKGYDLLLKEKSNHLVFAFRRNENLLRIDVVEEYIVQESDSPTTHYNLDGFIVLSHFVLNPEEVLEVPPELPVLAKDVHGSKGFGSRSRSHCLGFCSFTGPKNTRATRPAPL